MKIPKPIDHTSSSEPRKGLNCAEELHATYRKRVETILESFTDAFFEVDANWTVTYWNRTAEDLLLMPRQQIIGQNLWKCYPEATSLKFFTEYHRCLTEQTATKFEEYFAPRQMWFEVAVFPNGQGLSVYFKDITYRKLSAQQLENERQKYRDLFNHNPLPQWVYDIDDLSFLDVNEAAVVHYGYSREEFLTSGLRDIRPPEDIPELEKALLHTDKTNIAQRTVVRHRKKNGDIIYTEVKGNTIVFNGRPARLVVVVDKTEELKANIAKEESISKLRELSWMQAHEVRKPLSNLLGLTELFDLEDLSDQHRVLLTKFIAQVKELDSVIKKTMTRLNNK